MYPIDPIYTANMNDQQRGWLGHVRLGRLGAERDACAEDTARRAKRGGRR